MLLDPTHIRDYSNDHALLDILEEEGFQNVKTRETLGSRPLMDAIFRGFRIGRNLYGNRFFDLFRRFKILIPGDFDRGIVCVKKSQAATGEAVHNGS